MLPQSFFARDAVTLARELIGAFLLIDGIGAGVWAAYGALVGFVGGTAFHDHPALGLLLAFGIGLSVAALVEVGRRIASRRRTATSTSELFMAR